MKNVKDPNAPSTLVLVAALNEEKGIRPTLAELKKYLNDPHFLVVNGNSWDQTAHVAKSCGADVLCQDGVGKGNAIAFGLQYLSADFDYVVITDADFTYPAEYIPQMIRILDENPRVGMVCGNRFNTHMHSGSMHDIFYFGNRAIAFAHNLLNGIALRDPLTGLRVIRGSILKNWKPKSRSFDIEVELNHHVERKGYSIEEVEISYRKRIGEKKLKLKHGFTILRRIIIESIH